MEEIWKQYKNEFYISNYGKVKNIRTNNIRKTSIHHSGYERLWVKSYTGEQISIYIHKAVAELFVPNPDNKPIVNHKDGNKLNNFFTNLEWVTQQENMQHAFKNKLCDNSYKRKLTNNQVYDIINIYKNKEKSMQQLADMYNVSKTTIWTIIHNNGYNG